MGGKPINDFEKDRFLVIGHRGAAGLRPENTLASFERALELGVDAVELDVRQVEDTLLVFHDERLERTTNGRGRLADTPLSVLRGLDAGGGERIPTLDEVADLVGERAWINIELKERGIAAAVARFLRARPALRSLVSSFDHGELERLRSLHPEVPVAPLFETAGSATALLRTARRLDAWSVNVSRAGATPALLAAMRDEGMRALVYTVNRPEEARSLQAAGASGVFTDRPDRIVGAVGPPPPG